jgi:integrase/recombinase XerD
LSLVTQKVQSSPLKFKALRAARLGHLCSGVAKKPYVRRMFNATITLHPLEHRGESQVRLAFPFDGVVKEHIKQLSTVRWSQTHRCFYMPHSSELTGELMEHCKTAGIWVDATSLRNTSGAGRAVSRNVIAPISSNTLGQTEQEEPSTKILLPPKKVKASTTYPKLPPAVLSRITTFRQFLEQRRYASSSTKTYLALVRQFFATHPGRNWNDFTKSDLEAYNHQAFIVTGKSYSAQNQFINAIKLFYQVHKIPGIIPADIERPRKSTTLPEVLTKDEVGKLLGGLGNLKHRTLLSLVYACGLRIGEALTLRPADLRLAERLLYVRAAKGRKDRRVPLAGKIVELLDQYQTAYPCKEYLFEGQKGGAYSYTSARQVMKRAVTKAGLPVKATLHTLRHSYATHLLQSGTYLRYIQEILGRTSPKTTMLYTHVAANDLKKIRSSFDELEL